MGATIPYISDTSAVAAANKNDGNNENPNAVVIIEKIAKTVHIYPPSAAYAAISGKFCLPDIYYEGRYFVLILQTSLKKPFIFIFSF